MPGAVIVPEQAKLGGPAALAVAVPISTIDRVAVNAKDDRNTFMPRPLCEPPLE
jgi:hypothetical protein